MLSDSGRSFALDPDTGDLVRGRLERYRRERSATALERLPRVDAAADWGLSGQHTDDWKATRSVALGVSWPVFDGLRREARLP